MNIIVNTVAAMETGIMLNTNLHVTFPDIPGIQEKSPWMKFSWTGIIVHVNIKSAMAMLAMNKFMALVEWDYQQPDWIAEQSDGKYNRICTCYSNFE